MGAWIEINGLPVTLKASNVAPLVGAWIEMYCQIVTDKGYLRRSPRGSVD